MKDQPMSVAVLGLGAMGRRIAVRLLDAGCLVSVWNRSPEAAVDLGAKGAQIGDTPADAVRGADFVLCMVRDDAASRDVWLAEDVGAVHGLATNALALDCSTLTPAHVKDVGPRIGNACAGFVEVPVLGSRPQVEAGALVALVGGDFACLELARPILASFAGRIEYCGALGQAAALKLAINSFFATQVAAMGEVLRFLRAADVGDRTTQRVLADLPIVAPGLQLALGAMVKGQFEPQFPIELVAKDLDYFVGALDTGGSDHLISRVRDVFQAAVRQGLGGQNLTGIVQLEDRRS